MQATPHPLQERRLAALRSYGSLDTPRESDFDEIVALAAEICGTAVSLVNLIDAERQWFKAEVGLGIREMPLATSICAHTILEEDFVEINDTLTDPRMANYPQCVSEPGMRFYAGAHLRTAAGLPLGMLCVLHHEPKVLTGFQRRALGVLARQVMAQMELRREIRIADVLRQEVDHRVKNSLASVAAYASLKARAVKHDPEAEAVAREIGQKIAAVAMVHEQLYLAGTGASVGLRAYLANLGAYLKQISPAGIAVDTLLDREPVLESRRAASVGTFVNEAVSNAMKHAFATGTVGQIQIALRPVPGDRITVSVRDDGVGMPNEPRKGLGMAVARASAQELGSVLDVTTGPGGTAVSITFAAAG